MILTINVSKAKRSFNVDWDLLPPEARRHIIEYGLRQNLNDRVASAESVGEAEGLVMKRIDALYANEFRTSGGRENDPVVTEAKRLAEVEVRRAIRKAGYKIKEYEDQIPSLVKNYIAANPDVIAFAEENVQGRKAAPGVDLASLLAKPNAS